MMIEIKKQDLPKHLKKEILVREGGREFNIVFKKIIGTWIIGYCKTNHSIIQISLSGKQDEHSSKYFIE